MNYDRVKKEMNAYDGIAANRMRSDIGAVTKSMVGADLTDRFLRGNDVGQFPKPVSRWIDSIQDGVSQLLVYDWLCPIEGRLFVQLGGSGSHALKALMAGARRCVLVTPSAAEGEVAREMAEYLDLGDKLDVVIGIGERLPFASGSVDRVFGGGTLHHIQLEAGIPELARVLKAGGRAGFAEPRVNFIYKLLEVTKIRELVREPGAQCYPLKVSDVIANAAARFRVAQCKLSGGPVRYGIVGLTRGLKIKVPLALALPAITYETRILSRLRLSSLLGGLAVLFEK